MTIFKIVFLMILSMITLKVHSQPENDTEENIIRKLEQTNVDSTKGNLLIQLAKLYSATDKEKAIDYSQLALKYEMGDKKRALILNSIGFYYWGLGDFSDAHDFYHQSLSIYYELQDSTRIGLVTNNIATTSWSLGRWNEALQYYQKALKFREATKDLKGVSNILNNMGLIYQDFGLYDEALAYHNKALEIASEINNHSAISYSYSNMGLCYMKKKDFESALEYHKLGFKIYSDNDNNGRNNSYFLANIAMTFNASGDLDSALYYSNQSLEQAKLINNKYRIAFAENALGKSHLRIGNLEVAEKHINNSHKSALANNYKDLLRDNQFALAEIEDIKGNSKKAFGFYRNATAISDSLFNKKEISKFAQITIKQIQEKKESEKALLKENIKIQKTIIQEEKVIRWTSTAGILLLIIALIYISKSRKSIKKLNSKLLTSEEELKKSNADKIKFFSIISHDLRSPFNSIISLSDLLELEVSEKNTENLEFYTQTIKKSSQSAMNLLSNLMEWAMSQAGEMKFAPEKFDINKIANDNILFFKEIANQKAISIHSKIEGDLSVIGDKHMINAILRNLISNAIKFTSSGGELHISSVGKNNKAEIAVSDSGIGLTKESIEKLFKINSQFSTTGTENEQGTGLGLMLCKEFIEKHNEKIWVVSELGKGATFYFTLPMDPGLS